MPYFRSKWKTQAVNLHEDISKILDKSVFQCIFVQRNTLVYHYKMIVINVFSIMCYKHFLRKTCLFEEINVSY